MFECAICFKRFLTIRERSQHVTTLHINNDDMIRERSTHDNDDMIVTLITPEISLGIQGMTDAPLSEAEYIKKFGCETSVNVQNTESEIRMCENCCAGCIICTNQRWDDTGVFKVPAPPVKRNANESCSEVPKKKVASDDYWFCKVPVNEQLNNEEFLCSQDDAWLCSAVETLCGEDDDWLCSAAEAVEALEGMETDWVYDEKIQTALNTQDEFRATLNDIRNLDPTQSMDDFWSSLAEMAQTHASGDTEQGDEVDDIEQTGGALHGDRVSCPICALVFTNKRNMNRHKLFMHGNMFCPRCGQKFNNRTELMLHRRVCNVRGLPTNIPNSEFFNIEIHTALQNAVVTFCFKPKVPSDSLILCLSEFENFVTPLLQNYITLNIAFKVEVSCQVTFHKLSDSNVKIHPIFNHRQVRPLLLMQTNDDVREMLADELESIKIWVEEYNKMASNWILEEVEYVCINCHETDNDAGGAGAVKLPDSIRNAKCVINLESAPFNQCFKYAILTAAHYNDHLIDAKHRERLTNYNAFVDEYDFSVVTYPVNPHQIQLFEKANKNISVWAHYMVQGQAKCLYKSKCPERPLTVHLLRYEEHWLPIVNLSSLYKANRQGAYFKCVKCFKSFYHQDNYTKHNEAQCAGYITVQHETIPNPPILKFLDFEKTVDMPLVMYADIEEFCKNKILSRQIPRKLTSMYLLRLVTLLFLEFLEIPYMRNMLSMWARLISSNLLIISRKCVTIFMLLMVCRRCGSKPNVIMLSGQHLI